MCLMDKRKLANQQVKDRLLAALIDFAGRKDWSKVTVTELVEQAGVARATATSPRWRSSWTTASAR